MDGIVLVIIVLVFGGFLFLRLGGTVSADEARRHLREGALLVDVHPRNWSSAGSDGTNIAKDWPRSTSSAVFS